MVRPIWRPRGQFGHKIAIDSVRGIRDDGHCVTEARHWGILPIAVSLLLVVSGVARPVSMEHR